MKELKFEVLFLKFCWVIFTKVFSRNLLNSVAVFFDSKILFLIADALLSFRDHILHHRPLSRSEFFMTRYGNTLGSNQSPKLLILVLLCQPCRYELFHNWLLPFCHIFFYIYNFLLWRPLIANVNIFVSTRKVPYELLIYQNTLSFTITVILLLDY